MCTAQTGRTQDCTRPPRQTIKSTLAMREPSTQDIRSCTKISDLAVHLFCKLDHVGHAQAGVLLTNHIAPGRRTLEPSTCGASTSRMDVFAAVTTPVGWSRSQLLMAPIWVT